MKNANVSLKLYFRKAPCTTEQNSPARVRKTDSLDLSDCDEEIDNGSKVENNKSLFQEALSENAKLDGIIFILQKQFEVSFLITNIHWANFNQNLHCAVFNKVLGLLGYFGF